MYREFAAPPLACLWVRVGRRRDDGVLPDGCSDLIWQAGRGAFVAGPDTGPSPVDRRARHASSSARASAPARAARRSGCRCPSCATCASELDALRPELAERLPADLDPREALRRLAEIALRRAARRRRGGRGGAAAGATRGRASRRWPTTSA